MNGFAGGQIGRMLISILVNGTERFVAIRIEYLSWVVFSETQS